MIPASIPLIHAGFFDELDDAELACAYAMAELWRRPDQLISPGRDWRAHGFIAGRGNGKTWAIAEHITESVIAGEYRSIGLAAPTEARVEAVQWRTLIEVAPPWFVPELEGADLVWPNGARAEYYTPESPGRPRGSNHDFAWMTELVDWQATTRVELWNNLTTAVRTGYAQYVWDTTSRGKNELILARLAEHERDPRRHRLTRGAMFDNPMLSDEYLIEEALKYHGRDYDEEVLGMVYAESAGALWQQAWIDAGRVQVAPRFELKIVALDPAISAAPGNDATGVIVAGRTSNRHNYVVRDASDHHTAESWGDLVLDEHAAGAAGAVVERNREGDRAVFVLRARAERRHVDVRVLTPEQRMPQWNSRVLYVREYHAASSKYSRASGPAGLYESPCRAHHVGTFPELELEMTTYEPGTRKSPNRLDALAYALIELAGLAENRPTTRAQRAQSEGVAQARGSLAEQVRARARSQRV